jgi:Zn-dependent M28 family amino/carboxypeptidase
VNGDRIYNGAMDNAAGVAALLEAARALRSESTPPRRSVLFLAVTAEEKGMIGSDYFARSPTVPKDAIVAAVCLDMPVLLYDFTDVIAFGAEHSSLKGVLESALMQANLTLTPDPMPEQAIFTRSDHYRFVQQGVPSILLATGWNSTKGAGEGGKVFQNFFATTYHRPSDDISQPINYAAGARFAEVNYRILKAIANGDTRPSWNAGDFFGALYAAR